MHMSQQDLPNKSGRVINRSELRIETGSPQISCRYCGYALNLLRSCAYINLAVQHRDGAVVWGLRILQRSSVGLEEGRGGRREGQTQTQNKFLVWEAGHHLLSLSPSVEVGTFWPKGSPC